MPGLGPLIGKAIDADPAISEKTSKGQFEKLILHPLSKIHDVPLQTLRLFVVVDALDECEREKDIRTILLLLSQISDVTSICFQIFMTINAI
jgi:hypothetical protein